MNRRLRLAAVTGLVLFTAFSILVQSYYKLQTPILRADFISTLIPGIAPFEGAGSPYLDYWEVRPPALPMMTGLWGAIVGKSLWSFHLLWAGFLAAIMAMSWKILGRLFSFYEKIIVYLAFAVFFFANSVQTQFFPPEINGLFFCLAGLVFALKKNPSNRDVFLSSLLFIVAGQMKEVYAFAGLSLLPHLVVSFYSSPRKFWQFLGSTVGGVVSGLVIVVGYLLAIGSLTAYGELLAYKSQVFSPLNFGALGVRLSPGLKYLAHRFLFIPYNLLLLPFAAGLSLLFWSKKKLVFASKKTQQSLSLTISKSLGGEILVGAVAVCFSLGLLVGYLMQNRYNHIYDIAILPALILGIALSAKVLAGLLPAFLPANYKQWLPVLSLGLLAILLLPKQDLLVENWSQVRGYSPGSHLHRWLDVEKDAHIPMELKIMNNTSPKDCIDVQHGWNVGQQYYYSQRQPCTRFFLTNILPPEKASEYQQELVSNPPAALVYFTELTDLNVEEFDKNIFNFSEVIDRCFIPDDDIDKLYWPAAEKQEFAECFMTGLPNYSESK